jgi:hypothetical protein
MKNKYPRRPIREALIKSDLNHTTRKQGAACGRGQEHGSQFRSLFREISVFFRGFFRNALVLFVARINQRCLRVSFNSLRQGRALFAMRR